MSSVSVCSIDDDMNKELQAFRFSRSKKPRALILKIDPQSKELHADGELMEDITLEDLREELPEHQPRFVLYSFPYNHADARVSYPLCLIFSSPRESKTELMVMYAGSKLELEKRADANKVYELSDLDDLTFEWLQEKLAKWKGEWSIGCIFVSEKYKCLVKKKEEENNPCYLLYIDIKINLLPFCRRRPCWSAYLYMLFISL